jgi:hypothetical protein
MKLFVRIPWLNEEMAPRAKILSENELVSQYGVSNKSTLSLLTQNTTSVTRAPPFSRGILHQCAVSGHAQVAVHLQKKNLHS